MMSDSKSEGELFDPFQAWREIRDRSMDVWAKAMVEAVKSDDYAKASGAMLDAYLTASIPFREMLEKNDGAGAPADEYAYSRRFHEFGGAFDQRGNAPGRFGRQNRQAFEKDWQSLRLLRQNAQQNTPRERK